MLKGRGLRQHRRATLTLPDNEQKRSCKSENFLLKIRVTGQLRGNGSTVINSFHQIYFVYYNTLFRAFQVLFDIFNNNLIIIVKKLFKR